MNHHNGVWDCGQTPSKYRQCIFVLRWNLLLHLAMCDVSWRPANSCVPFNRKAHIEWRSMTIPMMAAVAKQSRHFLMLFIDLLGGCRPSPWTELACHLPSTTAVSCPDRFLTVVHDNICGCLVMVNGQRDLSTPLQNSIVVYPPWGERDVHA